MHTPGPWFTEVVGKRMRVVHGPASADGFRDDVPGFAGDVTPEGAANVRLAAAAPAMAEALEDMIRFYGIVRPGGRVLSSDADIERARAALAAAKGGAA